MYDVPANVILDSAARAISGWDIITSMIKAWVFGVIISVVREHVLAGTALRGKQVMQSVRFCEYAFSAVCLVNAVSQRQETCVEGAAMCSFGIASSA